jgi:hypothetical protein
MNKLIINRMSASIVGQAVTLTKSAGISDPKPPHLDASSIVVNTTSNPPNAEFWKQAASGFRYIVTIEIET